MNLYVSNISFDLNENELQQLFAAFGKVDSARIITDRDTGRSRGFGFVEMSNKTEAEAAIAGLNGKDAKGRPLTVNEARPKPEGGRGGSGGSGGGAGGGRSRSW